jgi:hypothetical protein
MPKRNAIALLLTLSFIIAVSALLAIGLKYVKAITDDVAKEKFMIQTQVLLEDVLQIFKQSKEIDALLDQNSSEGFYTFVQQSAFLPLNSEEIEVVIEIASARGKINLNTLKDVNGSFVPERVEALEAFLGFHTIDTMYAELLLDAMRGTKEGVLYNSDLFLLQPNLFRDYIASKRHLEIVNEYFKNRYGYNTLEAIDFEEGFYFSKNSATKVDLNFATPLVWTFLLECDKARAEQLYALGGVCGDLDCFGLNESEKELLSRFAYSFYEPVIAVKVTLRQNEMRAKIAFEYDMKLKKGSNFVYEI